MIHRFCHRCQAELPQHDEGTLIFCTHCGAPQVLLSEDLQAQVDLQNQPPSSDAALPTRDPRSNIWTGAIQCATLAGLIAAGLACLSMVFPPLILLVMLWTVVSPVVVLGIFQSRFPLVSITAGFGARLGLLTGLAVASVLGIINTASLMIARFGVHAMADVDKQMTANLDQFRTEALAQPGTPLLPWVNALSVPEFRAGLVLTGIALLTVMLLTITTVGGAFAGFVRSRPRS